jgi:hypothetical protein
MEERTRLKVFGYYWEDGRRKVAGRVMGVRR